MIVGRQMGVLVGVLMGVLEGVCVCVCWGGGGGEGYLNVGCWHETIVAILCVFSHTSCSTRARG